jgi:hypothetical protein
LPLLNVRSLEPSDDAEYQALVLSSNQSTFHHSLKYRNLLKKCLAPAQDDYLGAFLNGELVAALPLFRAIGPLGPVYNSLPFYGSHGGLIVKTGMEDKGISEGVIHHLVTKLHKENALGCTVVDPLFQTGASHFDVGEWVPSQQRIGQVNFFNRESEMSSEEGVLFNQLPSKRKWDIKKASQFGFSITHRGDEDGFKIIEELHREGMERVGGIAKNSEFFRGVREVLEYDVDYRIYLASIGEEVASALLVMYYQNTVEYFLPATRTHYLKHQPMSLLIFKSMEHAHQERGSAIWNWGGTWGTQAGVYQFKRGWGASDISYRYWTYLNGKGRLEGVTSSNLLEWYPNFFVYPFEDLTQ